MLFGHLRALYSAYFMLYRVYSMPRWLQVYSTTLGLEFAFCMLELGRIALEKRRRRRKMQELKNKYAGTPEKRRIRLLLFRMKQIRSLNAEKANLKARNANVRGRVARRISRSSSFS